MSEIMNRFRLLEPFQNKDAGFSRWTYGRRDDQTYFIKEFVDPVYPDQISLAESLRRKRIEECRYFAEKKERLYRAINECSDGNLLRVTDFFRCDSRYYIAMEKIDSLHQSFEELQQYPLKDRILLCRILAHSLMHLHSQKIVHADLKETNILIKKNSRGHLIPKIIDYDCGFFEYDPPQDERELGGDQVYLSPEACLFLCGEEVSLTCKMDVFSAGLLFHQYLTGSLPSFDHDTYDFAFEAVLDEQQLELSPYLQTELAVLIRNMLEVDPEKRISMENVYHFMDKYFQNPAAEMRTPTENREEQQKEEKSSASKSPADWFHQAEM